MLHLQLASMPLSVHRDLENVFVKPAEQLSEIRSRFYDNRPPFARPTIEPKGVFLPLIDVRVLVNWNGVKERAASFGSNFQGTMFLVPFLGEGARRGSNGDIGGETSGSKVFQGEDISFTRDLKR